MTDELKPCPFCGDEPALRKSQAPFRAEYMVICARGCGACNGWKDTAEEAITAWNTRKEPEELPEWAIEAINNLKLYHKEIFEQYKDVKDDFHTSAMLASSILQVINQILSIRKPEEK